MKSVMFKEIVLNMFDQWPLNELKHGRSIWALIAMGGRRGDKVTSGTLVRTLGVHAQAGLYASVRRNGKCRI